MRKFGIRATLALVLSVLLTVTAGAVPETLIPGGDAIGLELELDGVSVVELASELPGKGGLQCGDFIRSINHVAIRSIEDLQRAVATSDGRPLEILILRDGKEKTLKLSPLQTAEGWKLGIYVRDHLNGIGTVTYYESDGDFGALGHGVNSGDGNSLLPLQGGSVLPSEVASVEKGIVGTPGALRGAWQQGQYCGKVEHNTPQGIFGTMTGEVREAIPVGDASAVHKGAAEIRSTVQGKEVHSYSVEICEICQRDSRDRNLLLRVTDPELLAATGGIVQGMSGSPIIQDGKLVGAVTHVLVNDPTKGYGIFIENMLDAAG
jgi:stage IV sporulation protein B